VGASRVATVASIMTPSTGLVTAPPSFTVDKCAKAMRTGVFRHLPITDKGHVKAIISIRDIAQQISRTLAKAPMENPPQVYELMAAKGSQGFVEVGADASVADAVSRMQQAKAGSLVVAFDGSFGLFTERDYLTKVAVYDEVAASDIPISDVCTTAVTSVAPTARVTDCLALMLGGGFRHLPVTENKVPIGVISMRDITQFFLQDA